MPANNSFISSRAELNEWAKTSFWLGICSLLPYLLASLLSFIEKRTDQLFFQAEFILGLFCLFWGVILGLITLIIGIVALRQINNSQNTETGTPSAVLGMVFGLLAIVFNIVFVAMIFFQIVSA